MKAKDAIFHFCVGFVIGSVFITIVEWISK